jgi:hypothetical protein
MSAPGNVEPLERVEATNATDDEVERSTTMPALGRTDAARTLAEVQRVHRIYMNEQRCANAGVDDHTARGNVVRVDRAGWVLVMQQLRLGQGVINHWSARVVQGRRTTMPIRSDGYGWWTTA